jgi:hypothetical protein
MPQVQDQLEAVASKTAAALQAVDADGGASPVLVAVVREFDGKAAKATKLAGRGMKEAREAVVELEQAGDSAKAAAEADSGAGEAAKKAVLDAHLSICVLKSKV